MICWTQMKDVQSTFYIFLHNTIIQPFYVIVWLIQMLLTTQEQWNKQPHCLLLSLWICGIKLVQITHIFNHNSKDEQNRWTGDSESWTTFTCTEYSIFYPYSKKDKIPTKLFTGVMKLNSPFIFLFTCSWAYWYQND